MALRDADRKNWHTLQSAWKAGRLALIESRDLASGEYRALVCAMGQEGETILPTPLAVMIWDNPYEQFADPTADTLPPAVEPKDIPEVRKLTQVIEALRAAQDELSAIADGKPDLVDDKVLDQIAEALEPLEADTGDPDDM